MHDLDAQVSKELNREIIDKHDLHNPKPRSAQLQATSETCGHCHHNFVNLGGHWRALLCYCLKMEAFKMPEESVGSADAADMIAG